MRWILGALAGLVVAIIILVTLNTSHVMQIGLLPLAPLVLLLGVGAGLLWAAGPSHRPYAWTASALVVLATAIPPCQVWMEARHDEALVRHGESLRQAAIEAARSEFGASQGAVVQATAAKFVRGEADRFCGVLAWVHDDERAAWYWYSDDDHRITERMTQSDFWGQIANRLPPNSGATALAWASGPPGSAAWPVVEFTFTANGVRYHGDAAFSRVCGLRLDAPTWR